jgi:hypothetical protein
LAVEERFNRALEYKLQDLVKGARKVTAGTPAAKNEETPLFKQNLRIKATLAD